MADHHIPGGYLARTFRVITIDPRGNGRSDRPQSPQAYADIEFVAGTIAVLGVVTVRLSAPFRAPPLPGV